MKSNPFLSSQCHLATALLLGAIVFVPGCAGDIDENADTSAPGADSQETDPANSGTMEGESSDEGVSTSEQALYQDGCSAQWAFVVAGATIDPLFFFAPKLFRDQCIQHDYCYQGGLATYGKVRANCDTDFRDNMRAKCDATPLWQLILDPLFKVHCKGIAQAMYVAVSDRAGPHYKSSLCLNGEVYSSANHDTLDCSAWEPYAGTPTRAPVSCQGTSGQWDGCRGSGCTACTELLTAYPKYFKNNPYCTPNSTCAGEHYTCNTACPAPTSRDR